MTWFIIISGSILLGGGILWLGLHRPRGPKYTHGLTTTDWYESQKGWYTDLCRDADTARWEAVYRPFSVEHKRWRQVEIPPIDGDVEDVVLKGWRHQQGTLYLDLGIRMKPANEMITLYLSLPNSAPEQVPNRHEVM